MSGDGWRALRTTATRDRSGTARHIAVIAAILWCVLWVIREALQ